MPSILRNMPPQDDDDIRRQRDAQRSNVERAASLAYAYATSGSAYGTLNGFAVPVGAGSGADPSAETDAALCRVMVPGGYTNAVVTVTGQASAFGHPPAGATTDWFYGRLRALVSSTGQWATTGDYTVLALPDTPSTTAPDGASLYPSVTPTLAVAFSGIQGGYIECAVQVRPGLGWTADASNFSTISAAAIFTR